MDVLKRFDRLRPDDDYLDDATRDRIWSEISGTGTANAHVGADTRDVVEVDRGWQAPLVANHPNERPQGRRFALVGAAAIVVIGLGGFATLQATRSTEPSPAAAATDQPSSSVDPVGGSVPAVTGEPPVLIGMALPSLPDGLVLLQPPLPPSVRSEPSGFQVRVFGALADPQDPTQMIRVEYAESRAMAIPCHSFLSLPMPDGAIEYSSDEWTDAATPIGGSTPFAVAATTGSYCSDPSGLLQAGWFTGKIGVSLSAGTGVTPKELVGFAQSLKSVAPAEQLAGRPSVDLVSDPLPAGLTVLVGEDVAFTQQVTEASWVATVGGVDGVAGQLIVQTWQGADEHGVYAKHAPIQAQRITIRGHDGYQYTSTQRSDNGPLEVQIWWTETPGLVVSVWSTELFEPDELTTIIEQMVPVDAAGYNTFIGAPENS
jgi:hypothetical protein